MKTYIIAHNLSADLMKDDRDIFDFKMSAWRTSIVVRVKVKVHTDLQVRQRAIRLNGGDLMVFSKDKKVGVLHSASIDSLL
jgi:hypothetical protein